MKKTISVMLSVIMVMSLLPLNVLTVSASTFAGGDGTPQNPYQISTAEQLDAVRINLDANYILVNDIDLSKYDNWVPIGNYKKGFTGIFDGNNHTIYNMTIRSYVPETFDDLYVGLFGVGNKLHNINMQNINITIGIESGNFTVGGIAGTASIIKNCSTNGKISITDGRGITVGGIVGYGLVQQSTNYVNIYATSNAYYSGASDVTVGGIAGHSFSTKDKFCNNINYGDIVATSCDSISCGGILGECRNVYECINYGKMEGTTTERHTVPQYYGNCNVGGIAGIFSVEAEICDCLNAGDVSAKAMKNGSVYSGGIVGSQGSFNDGRLNNCYNICSNVFSEREYSTIDINMKTEWHTSYGLSGRIAGSISDASNCYSNNKTIVNDKLPTEDLSHNKKNGESKTLAEIKEMTKDLFEIEVKNEIYSGIFAFSINDDGNAVITKIVNNDDTETISIPTEIDGYKVVAIDEYCIPDSANIKRITIPSTITHIDENAFNGYDGIEIIYYFSTEDDWIEITDGIHYISDDTELVYVMDDVENTEISDYNKPEKKKDNNVNFTNAIRDWEKEKNDWIDTLVKVVNNIKDDISVSNEDAINNNYEKNKERIDAMIADEGWYQSGSDSARDAAFRAVYDMIADWGEESISLDKVDPSSDVVDFSTRIVKNVINGMKNQTIEKDYGDYTVLITVSGISTGLFENPAFTGSVTVKHKNGKTFGPALIYSTVDDTKQVMSDYMLQLKELEENTIEMAMETYISDLISLTDSKLPLDAIKEKLDSASEIINDTLEEKGLGNLNNFIGGIIDVIKSTKEVIELQNSGDTDALIRAVADLDSKLDFLSEESTTATSATLDWAYKNLKQKTKYLKEVTEAYIDGKEIPEYETTLDKIVGWFDKHIFQCPVDVYVYNGNDELIGCVSDAQIFGDTEEIYVEKNGDTKTVYVAEGSNVYFKLVGTDIGNLDYVAETYSENKVVGRTNFYGIELYDGKEITAETTDETAPNNCNEIILQSDGEIINTTEYLKATDNASVLIQSNVEGSGTVVGTGWYVRGDSVTLVASPDEGYVFKGWYNGDTPITFNANYTFCAKDFIEVTAKFEKYEENYSVSIPASESFKTIYDISADSDEDNVYFYVKELSEEANASKLNLYLAEYETSGKLSTLKIADIKVDSNGTVIFTTPYPQLEDFKIMLWTNNITPVVDVLN